jgi:hypothetical protein
LLLASLSTRTSAQAPPSNDVNAALIRELHDLRLAIEKLASATPACRCFLPEPVSKSSLYRAS